MGMRKFYLYIGLFLLPILVFLGGAEYIVRSIPNEYRYKNEWMNQHADEVETLIFGSSHAWFGINPAYFDGVTFNLSFMSQSPKYDCFLLEKWGDNYKKLKTIIVPISYFTFFFDEPFGVPQVAAYYRIYMDCPYHSWLSVAGLELTQAKALHGKLITLRENQWKVLCDEYGWHAEPFVPKDDDWDDAVKVRNLVGIQTGSVDAVEQNYSYLKEMAAFCSQHHVRMILVSIPMSDAYNKALDRQQLAVTYQQIQRAREELKLDYYDYREDTRFSDDDFADLNHLNTVGSEKFTRIMIQDMQLNN